PESEGDPVHGGGEEEGVLAEGHRDSVALDVSLRRLEDGTGAVRAGEGREDEPREQQRGLRRPLLLPRIVQAEEVDRRAEAEAEPVLQAVDPQQVALGRLVDPPAAIVPHHARERLLRAAAAAAGRRRDVVDGAGTQRKEQWQRGVAVRRPEAG